MPGEQYWEDGRIRSGAGGYSTYYDAVDSCWVGGALGGVIYYIYIWIDKATRR